MSTEKLTLTTPDFTDAAAARIAELFPNVVTEGRDEGGKPRRMIDFDLLKQELSADIVEGPAERYHLNWPGKRAALREANRPIDKTLRPARAESVDFDTTRNLFIEGDNLDALKLLQETYLGKVKMIYIDPPYNTGKDFIYKDNFTGDKAEHLEASGQVDEDGGKLVANPENNGRYHSDWLSMMYPRLKLARNLLREDGVIFISIDDNEQAALKKICDEIFGEDNFVASLTRIAKRTSDKGTHFRPTKDHVIVYARTLSWLPEFGIPKNVSESDYKLVDSDGRKYKQSGASLYQPSLDSRPNQRYYIEAPDGSLIIPPGNVFPEVKEDGAKIKPASNADKVWRWSEETYQKQKHLLIFTEGSSKNPLLNEHGDQSAWNIYPKVFYEDDAVGTLHPEDVIYDFPNSQGTKELKAMSIPFSFAKPSRLIEFFVEMLKDDNALVLDFFAGSATTAHAVIRKNAEDAGTRKTVSVQLPEPTDEKSEAFKAGYRTIAEISKERIRRAGAKILEENPDLKGKLDVGFRVLKIDSSNLKDVRRTAGQTAQADLVDLVENIKPDRTGEDLLFQVMLNWGVDLGLPIARETLAGKAVYFVAGDALAGYFDGAVDEALIKALAERSPLRAVFRDDAFPDDAMRINAEQLFKQLSPRTELRVI